MIHRSLLVLALLLLLAPLRASGQSPQALRVCVLYGTCPSKAVHAAPAQTAPFSAAVQEDSVRTAALYAAGLLGGAAGMLAGGAAGYYLFDRHGSGGWIPAMTILGGLVGEGVGVPLGVHLANGRRGNILLPLIVSPVLAVATPFLALAVPIRVPAGAVLVAGGIVAVQLYGSVQAEVSSSR